MHVPIDCVVVGYNDISFADMVRRAELSKDISGGYRNLMFNSAPFRGRRLTYTDLLNGAIEGATGRPSHLNVSRLPSLGVSYLVSFLRRRSLRAEFINFFNYELDRFRELLRERPRAVAITTTFYYEPKPVQEIVAFVREHSPETKIIAGGPYIYNVCTDHAPGVQDSLLQEIGADIYVFDSQGEATLAKVCSALQQTNPNLTSIPNLVYTADGKTFERNQRIPEANDMDTESVDWRLFEPDFVAPTVQTRTARSCAYKCSFCRFPVMAGPLNLTSVEVMEREMKYLHSIGVTRVLFIDDTFNIPLKRFKEICRMMIRNDFRFKWSSFFRCGNADAEAFDLLSESGCEAVFLGIESADDGVLRVMNKAATVDKYVKGIEQLNRRGILSYASFIVGHPGETEQSARNSLAFIEATRPTFYCLQTFWYDPKIPIGSRAFEFGLTGTAYAWKHNTMDWRRASQIVEEGYRTIANSTVCPTYGFDLWAVAYLMGQGISVDQLRKFLNVASQMLPYEVGDERIPALENELIGVFRPAGQESSDMRALAALPNCPPATTERSIAAPVCS